MERCDFSSVMQIISNYISQSESINQTDLLQECLFDNFFQSKYAEDFSLDNGLVCKWLNGTAKISPRIIEYYSSKKSQENLSYDIENLVFPLLYDLDMAICEIYNLVMNDTGISPEKKTFLCKNYPYDNEQDKADFVSRVLYFSMEITFIKRDSKTKELLALGSLSPIVKDYIIDGFPPKACKHFCGRDNELKTIDEMLKKHDKIFLQGVAGIGKSELAKKYAEAHKKDYTNILFFTYTGDLKQMIADFDFSDDKPTDNVDVRFKNHNRFLRSLKEDTLIIIDNFNTTSTKEPIFDVIMKYRCRILFTTRSRFDNYHFIDISEMADIDSLLNLVGYFYGINDKNIDIVKQIIEAVHYHTLAVELSARLLASGILNAKALLQKLQETKTVLDTDDRIGIVKDGKSTQSTYYEHIHTLITLACLSDKAQNIMRNMAFIPTAGINPKMFAKWLELKNLNDINDLIELGFIQKTDCRKIYLHPLIQEVTVDDTKPSISNCKTFIDNIRFQCLFHGIDLPYHKLLFTVAENIIIYAEKDDIRAYIRLLVDVFPYMEKYRYKMGMDTILSELEQMTADGICDISEQALLLDYKATYEIVFNNNFNKSLHYQKKAAEYCDGLEKENPLLVSNIYSNLGGVYLSNGNKTEARKYMELGYSVLKNAGLDNSRDGIAQVFNYANLAAELGEYNKAVTALERCAKVMYDSDLYDTTDYANILWGAGLMYVDMGEIHKAQKRIDTAWEIYSEVWKDEPELIEAKCAEFISVADRVRLTSPNGYKLQEFMDKYCC